MEHLTEPPLWAVLIQAFALASYIPISYFAYRWVRAPVKHDQVIQSLLQLGVVRQRSDRQLAGEYVFKDYVWPIFMACFLTFSLYITISPYFIQRGLVAGIFEEVIDIFGADDLFPGDRAILAGRFLFWGWLGAYIYSFQLTFRRFLSYDLTPSVYIFTSNRFFLSFAVGAIVGVGIGTFATAAKVPFDVNMATVSIIAFFIGFFPEQGVNWLVATTQKALKQQGGIVKEIRLSEIEGLSIWHQGRLKQEDVDNVQNLATADVPSLVISTAFPVTQLVDWIDQAILLTHTNQEQVAKLDKVGIYRAAELLANTDDNKSLQSLANASSLDKDELKVLRKNLLSAINIKLVSRFRWQASMDPAKVKEASVFQIPNR